MRGGLLDKGQLVEGLQALRLEALAQADKYEDMIETLQNGGRVPVRKRASARAGVVRLSDALEPKRKISAAGRKAIGDAARKRWKQWRKDNPK